MKPDGFGGGGVQPNTLTPDPVQTLPADWTIANQLHKCRVKPVAAEKHAGKWSHTVKLHTMQKGKDPSITEIELEPEKTTFCRPDQTWTK